MAHDSPTNPGDAPDRLRRTELLVAAAQRRETGALDALVHELLDDVRAFVRLKMDPGLRVRESCSDIVQSVCREVVEDLGGFADRGPGSFRAWLFTAALNKIRQKHQYWKAQKRDAAREATDVASGTGASTALYASLCSLDGSPSDHAIAREQAARIERAMDKLSHDQRDVLLRHRIVGQSHREIAEETGRTEVAVRSLLSRASVRLLAALEERI